MSLAPKRAGRRAIEGEGEHCYGVKWGNSCSLVWCMHQSFAVREDGELHVLCEGDVLSCGCSHTSVHKNNTVRI
jgi:hypothetical protein